MQYQVWWSVYFNSTVAALVCTVDEKHTKHSILQTVIAKRHLPCVSNTGNTHLHVCSVNETRQSKATTPNDNSSFPILNTPQENGNILASKLVNSHYYVFTFQPFGKTNMRKHKIDVHSLHTNSGIILLTLLCSNHNQSLLSWSLAVMESGCTGRAIAGVSD